MKILKKILYWTLIIAFWVGLWAVAAWHVGKPLLFPTPWAVLVRLFELLGTKTFYEVTATSIGNITAGIIFALILGCVLALLSSRIKPLRDLCLPVMTVIKATPVASFIILVLIFLGSAKVPGFITFLIVLPVIWTNLDEGLSRIDQGLSEIADIYHFSFWKRLKLLVFPSVKPYFLSACRTSLGLAWKAGVAAEIIAMPRGTIGTMIGEAKLYIETVDMFAWTLTVVILSLVIELAVTRLFALLSKQKEVSPNAEI